VNTLEDRAYLSLESVRVYMADGFANKTGQ
jgi:hypothetical protein